MFRYSSLQSSSAIRLIDANFGRDENDLIHCRLAEVDLVSTDLPPYHCLTYTWGNPFETNAPYPDPVWGEQKTITVSSESNLGVPGRLSISKNLGCFLKEFERRKPKYVQYIWIDAICISQSDPEERAAQVKLMGQIFFNCEAIMAWIGPEGPETMVSLDMIKRMNNSSSGGLERREEASASGETPKSPLDEWDALGVFFKRSWFHRVWTLQECVLPKEGCIWCGTHQFPLRYLTEAIEKFGMHLRRAYNPAAKYLDRGTAHALHSEELYDLVNRLRWGRLKRDRLLTHKFSPFEAVSDDLTRPCSCSDPRDNVYSILGLFGDDSPITIDYRQPVVDIYVDFAQRLKEFQPLFVEDPSLRKTAGLPSWVPDYRVAMEPIPWVQRAGYIYKAGVGVSGNQTIEFLQSNESRILALSSFHEDTVEYAGASYVELFEADGFIKSLALLLQWMRTHECDGDPIEAFWRTLIVNLTGNGPRPPDADEYGASFRATVLFFVARWLSRPEASELELSAVESLLSSLNAAAASPFLPDWESISRLRSSLVRNSQGNSTEKAEAARGMTAYIGSLNAMFRVRRFFITRKGRLGVGSVTVAPGDHIHIVNGLRYPILLRPADSGRYRWILPCYVRGIMYGEALSAATFSRIEIE